jgi:uncharacterized membrane protein
MPAPVDRPMGALYERLLGIDVRALSTRPEDTRQRAVRQQLPRPTRRACLVVVLAIVAYTAVLSFFSIQRYTHFVASAFDLGIYDQALWLISRGDLRAFSTVRGLPILHDHWTPILYPLGLMYRLYPDPRGTMVVQSLWLALGAWPLFRWTCRAAGNPSVAAWMAVAYLLYPALLYTNLWDFHPGALAATPLLFAMEAIDRGARGSFLIWVATAIICKETVALTVLVIAGSLIVQPRYRRIGLLTLAMSIAVLVGVHVSNPETPYVYLYRRFGHTVSEVVWGCVTSPKALLHQFGSHASAAFLKDLLHPCLYLPLLSPLAAAPAVPEFLLDLLSSRPSMHSIRFQYTSTIAPFLWLATARTLARLHRRLGWSVSPFLAAACGLSVSASGLPELLPWSAPRFDGREMQQVATRIPRKASLSIAPCLLPHFDHRHHIYAFPNPFCQVAWGNTVTALVDQQYGVGLSRANDIARVVERKPVDFVLVVLHEGAWPCTPALDERVKQVLVQSPAYDELLRTDHLLLLRSRCLGPSADRSGVGSRERQRWPSLNEFHRAGFSHRSWGQESRCGSAREGCAGGVHSRVRWPRTPAR